jgi:tripartite-type tricarboxylate transporter receptor subunit TctC
MTALRHAMALRRFYGAALAFCASLAIATPAVAQGAGDASYPDGLIKIVVPFPAGGPLDTATRILADGLRTNLGRNFIVENRPGAAGNVGTGMVAAAAPDGRTLLAGLDATFTVNPHVYEKLPFDPERSFEPIARLGAVPLALAVNANKVPARTLQDLIAYSQTHVVSFSSAGSGAPGHLALEYLRYKTALKADHVPYRGNAPASTALLAGEVDAAFIAVSGVLPHIQSGALIALATSGATRIASLPNVPTTAEAGVPGFAAVFANVLMAPAGTPPALIKLLNTQTQTIMSTDEVQRRMAVIGLEPIVGTPEGLRQWIAEEGVRWAAVAKATGMKLD